MKTNDMRWKQRFENFKNARKQFMVGLVGRQLVLCLEPFQRETE